MNKKISIVFYIFFHCFYLSNKKNFNVDYWYKEGNIFGTTYYIVLELPENYPNIKEIEYNIERIFYQIDNAFSLYKEDSKIKKLNKNLKVEFEPEEIELFQISKEICIKTKGHFFPYRKEIIKKLKTKISIKEENYNQICNLFQVDIHNQIVKKYDFIEFDLNAITEGFTLDWIRKILKQYNIESYMIYLGGEICLGKSPGVRPEGWWVVLESLYSEPFSRTIYKTMNLSSICISSSGNYYKNHIYNIYNPYNPHIKLTKKMVTVFGPSCTIADAYATYISIVDIYELYSNEYYVEIEWVK